MKYPTYSTYKPSGVEWLGDVPAHWGVKRGRFCMSVNPRSDRLRTLDPEDEVSFVPMEAVGEYGGLSLESSRPLEEIGSSYTPFEDGDVVVAKITPCFENGKGALAAKLVNGAALGTTELHVLRASPLLARRFLFYLTISEVFRKTGEAEMYGAGGQKRVPAAFIKNYPTPLPPLEEQHTIADFLDTQTTKIDALIETKQKLIEKLKEKRTALITHTVSHGLPPDAAQSAGLNPYPEFKPSGIEWLGDIPEHWVIKRLKFLLTEALKYGANEPAELDDPDLPRYVRITDIDDSGDLRDETFRSIPEEVASPYMLKDGDLLFARSGATSGKTFLYNSAWGRCAYAGYLIRARLNPTKVTPVLLRYYTSSKSYWDWLSSIFIQATIQNVSADKYANLWVPLPPIDEQRAIANFLKRESEKISSMIAKVEDAIEGLQEYRTALITAAVTGKIDVRGITTEAIEEANAETVA